MKYLLLFEDFRPTRIRVTKLNNQDKIRLLKEAGVAFNYKVQLFNYIVYTEHELDNVNKGYVAIQNTELKLQNLENASPQDTIFEYNGESFQIKLDTILFSYNTLNNSFHIILRNHNKMTSFNIDGRQWKYTQYDGQSYTDQLIHRNITDEWELPQSSRKKYKTEEARQKYIDEVLEKVEALYQQYKDILPIDIRP